MYNMYPRPFYRPRVLWNASEKHTYNWSRGLLQLHFLGVTRNVIKQLITGAGSPCSSKRGSLPSNHPICWSGGANFHQIHWARKNSTILQPAMATGSSCALWIWRATASVVWNLWAFSPTCGSWQHLTMRSLETMSRWIFGGWRMAGGLT